MRAHVHVGQQAEPVAQGEAQAGTEDRPGLGDVGDVKGGHCHAGAHFKADLLLGHGRGRHQRCGQPEADHPESTHSGTPPVKGVGVGLDGG